MSFLGFMKDMLLPTVLGLVLNLGQWPKSLPKSSMRA